ncbi:MAG: NAD(+)/NADH kinase, partial [Halobacteria archaeon]|nr:NAD(+)/NADH kinase [Halobacteria archaeon]
PQRAVGALESLREHASRIEVITYRGVMGENECVEAGLDPEVVGEPKSEETTAEDTRDAVKNFVEKDVDLILFVGGDGTAVDVTQTLDALNDDTPILGVPAGVKVYSSVFAVRPSEAGRIAATFERV